MNTEGYIKLHRQITDSYIFANPNHLKIFIWCLCKASRTDRAVPLHTFNGTRTYKLKKGQFLFGRLKAAEELCMTGSMIYRAMDKMEAEGMIKREADNHCTVVSVCNWELYQEDKYPKRTADEQQADNKRTTSEQQADTNKNVKNVIEDMRDSLLREFETFWDSYNKKKDKKRTLQKWRTLPQHEREEILRHAPIYAKATPNPQYRKDPLTYLNSESWKDEHTPQHPAQLSGVDLGINPHAKIYRAE